MIFIYGLFDPRNLELRYIGKSVNPDRRLYFHVREAKISKGSPSRKVAWIKQLLSNGVEPSLEILEECTEDNWQQSEQEWIKDCKKFEVRLTNLTDGGENPPNWEEMNDPESAKKKISESNRRRKPPNLGRKWSQEYKRKMSASLSGNRNPMYGLKGKDHPATGREVSDITRQRLSKALSGKNNPMYGKTHTKEAKRKLSMTSKGRKQSGETRLKRSLSSRMYYAKKRGDDNLIMQLQQEYFDHFREYHSRYIDYV